jgi:hypothetical protein
MPNIPTWVAKEWGLACFICALIEKKLLTSAFSISASETKRRCPKSLQCLQILEIEVIFGQRLELNKKGK